MKIICLNTWGGRVKEPLENFLLNNQEIDIFCFQEVYSDAVEKDEYCGGGYKVEYVNFDLLTDLKKLLPNHTIIYHPHLADWWGLATAVKKDINILEQGEKFVYKEKFYDIEKEKQGHTAKNIQYIKVLNNDKNIYIINFHGLWNGMGKDDTPDRLKQSQNIVDFIQELSCEIVLVGDFNLLPDTKSIKILEDSGLRNLIKEYTITSTRTSFYKKPLRIADYAFTTNNLEIKEFKILPEEVSDHNAIYLEI